MLENLMEITLSASGLILILLILSPLIKKSFAAKWRYFAWLFLVVRLLVPFTITLPEAPVTISTPVGLEPLINARLDALSAPAFIQPVQVQMQQADTFFINLYDVIFFIWLCGIAVFVLYHAVKYLGFKKQVRRWSRPVIDENLIAVFQNQKSQLRIRKQIGFMLCENLSGPLLYGFFKPVLLLPLENYSSYDAEAIIKHELVHFKRHDIWYKLLLLAAHAVHWFNPLIILMQKAANKDIELSCDDEVVKNTDIIFRRSYSRTILNSLSAGKGGTTQLSTCFYAEKKALKDRFLNILDTSKKRKGILALLLVLVLAVSGGAVVAFQSFDLGEKAPMLLDEAIVNYIMQPIGADMASIDFASDDRVIFHYGKALIAYDLKEKRILHMLDLSKLDVSYATQGDTVIDIKADDEGKRVLIGSYPKGSKAYLYDIEKSTVKETSMLQLKNSFTGLYEMNGFGSEIWNPQDGWNSIFGARYGEKIFYLLYPIYAKNISDMQLVSFNGRKKNYYDIFRTTNGVYLGDYVSHGFENRMDIILNLIPKDRQIAVNSGVNFSFVLTDNISYDGFDLGQTAKKNQLDIEKFYGKTVFACIYSVETADTSSQQYTSSPYVFFFCEGELMGWENLKKAENEQNMIRALLAVSEKSKIYEDQLVIMTERRLGDAYSPYYQILGFEVGNYNAMIDSERFTATFMLKMKYKNFYQDPDTVGYIKEAKEKKDKNYRTLYDEYSKEQESNFNIKAVADFKEGKNLDIGTIEIYNDISAKGEGEYVPIEQFLPGAN